MPGVLTTIFRILSYLGLGCLIVLPVRAAEYVVTPSVTVQETYDDNLFFYDMEDFECLVSADIELTARTERIYVSGSAGCDISEYRRHNELDGVDHAYEISAHALSSATSRLGISGRYIRDHTTDALEESGDVVERCERTRASVQPSAAIELDPRNRIEGSCSLSEARYELDRYTNHTAESLNVTWVHDLANERTSILFQIGGNLTDYETDLRQRTCLGLVGIDHRFTEDLKIELNGGGRYTKSKSPGGYEENTGFSGSLGLTWRFEKSALLVNISEEFTPSMYGEDMIRDRANISLRHRLTENLKCGLTTSYYKNRTEGIVRTREYETFSIRPSVNYRFGEYLHLQLGYSYTATGNEITSHSKERNRIYVRISSEWPLHP
ncbi:MAG: TonB-dependent receptor [Deltaproteobacteria bacterium]|jgi:hypothetical protein|nr:TonB-dependent receptor [Deltaproteobacteria bacterium]MDL1978807.1 TonB-dependent receptor [Deltaproteobacteria bacterium]